MPNKSFVYGVLFSSLLSDHQNLIEPLLDEIFKDLQLSINLKNQSQSLNIMEFFGEIVKLEVMNSFTFISLLMDLVSESEKNLENFEFLIYLVLNSLSLVQGYLLEKFEMEFKNLVEDIERIYNKQMKKNPKLLEGWVYVFY